MPKITEMFAFVAEEAPGEEGIAGMKTGMGWLPLVGADMSRVTSLKEVGQNIANATGRSLRIVRFSVRTDLETLEPKR